MEVSLDLPEVLIDRIADAVAARVGSMDGGGASPWMGTTGAAAYLGTLATRCGRQHNGVSCPPTSPLGEPSGA
jgi:hypothetical protein